MEQKLRDKYIKSCLGSEMEPLYNMIGELIFKQVIDYYAGKQPYFIKKETYHKIERNLNIYDKFMNGRTVKELAGSYNVSESEVRKIVKKVGKVING